MPQLAKNLRKNSLTGFTLVELIISVTIFSVAATAIYSVFSNGVAAWRRGNSNKKYARNIRITSEKMARDLRNTFEFNDIPFDAESDFMMFPGLILARTEKKGKEEVKDYYQVGKITYFYNQNKKALCKEERSFLEIASESDKRKIGEGEVLIEQVKSAEFEYCYLDNATGDYEWKDDWKEDEQDSIPQAVKMKLTFEKEIQPESFEKIVFIPIGTGEQKKELGKVEIERAVPEEGQGEPAEADTRPGAAGQKKRAGEVEIHLKK
ncbi:MAG: prepilin-type N-terminal cleavage/methylation domain-containing protein [Candidatus Omnitrophica bacterium]|nr:prepilin-type N-terminal cleavage/methylation domain-containing protein [Candidatus Omnitrophota bacterium]